MHVEVVNDFSDDDLWSAYDVGRICVVCTPTQATDAPEVRARVYIGDVCFADVVFADGWYDSFFEEEAKWTRTVVEKPPPPHDVAALLRRGAPVFLGIELNHVLLDCMKDLPAGPASVELRVEIEIDGTTHTTSAGLTLLEFNG